MKKNNATNAENLGKNNKAKISLSSTEAVDFTLQDAKPFPSSFSLIKKDKIKNIARITLNDCLACSGCVTTAETILIQQQSVDEFLRLCEDKSKVNIVSISPQGIISLATYFNMSREEAAKRLSFIFQNLGVK